MNDDARSVDGIIQGWWAYHEMGDNREARVRRERPTEPEDTAAVAAWMSVGDTLSQGGPRALELILALARSAHTGARVEWAAGAMQNLLMEHDVVLAEDVARLAATDARVARVLRSTWVLDESLDAGAHRALRPWMPHLHDGAVRPPARPRPRGGRWKDRDTAV